MVLLYHRAVEGQSCRPLAVRWHIETRIMDRFQQFKAGNGEFAPFFTISPSKMTRFRHFLKMKKTAPQRQRAAQMKSRRNFSPMKNRENGTNTDSVMTSCMILSWASVSVV